MKRKNALLFGTSRQSCLPTSIGKLLLLISIGVALFAGCDLDLDRDRDAESPAIEKLKVKSPINIQEAIDIIAVVPLNEDRDLKYEYRWTANHGEIKHNGVWDTDSRTETHSKKITDRQKKGKKDKKEKRVDNAPSKTVVATYIAPETAGTYTITLKVCTRYAVAEKSVNVVVTDYIIESFPRAYWKANGNEHTLTYEFDVEAIRRSPILLRYKIRQDPDQAKASLSININKQKGVTQAIGNSKSMDPVTISGEIDVTKYINRTGKYEITLTLKSTENIMENTWFLKNIQIIGVEGDFLP